MTLFLNSRPFKIEIANTDVTLMVVDGGVSEDKVSQDGVITKSGSLTLQYNGTEHLDPRENPKWLRGKKCVIWLTDPNNGEIKKYATLYLSKDGAWDGAWVLKIDLTCILGFLSDRSAPDDKSDVCPGKITLKNTVIRNLLTEALHLVPNPCVRTSVPGILTTPPEKGNASYISLAGQIAYSEGYALKTDSDGCIISGRIDTNPTRMIGVVSTQTNAMEYSLQGSGELPPNRIRFQQPQKKTNKVPDTRTTISKRYGAASEAGVSSGRADNTILLELTTTTETLSPGSRTRTRTTIVQRAKGLAIPLFYAGNVGLFAQSEKIIETHKYERGGNDTCKDGGQGRLLVSTVEIWRHRGSPDALGEWYGLHRIEGLSVYYPNGSGGEAIYASNPSDLILAERQITTYKYLNQGGDGVTIVGGDREAQTEQANLNTWKETRYFKLAGKLYPRAWKLSTSYTSGDVDSLVFAGVDREEWRRSFPDEWEKETTQTRALGESNSQAVDSQYQLYLQGKIGISDVRNAATRVGSGTVEREFGNSGQLNPPAADTFPAEHEVEESSADVEISLRDYSGYKLGKQSERSISIPYLTPGGGVTTAGTRTITGGQGVIASSDITSISTKGFPTSFNSAAQRIGNLTAALIWGRSKGAKVGTDLRGWMFDMPVVPAIEIIEFDPISRTNKRFKYLVDGLSVAFDAQQLKTEMDLIYLGRIGSPISTTIFAAATPTGATILNIGILDRDLSAGTIIVVGETIPVTTTSPTRANATEISVSPITSSISAGSSIVFGDQRFTVTTSVPAGATSIPVLSGGGAAREIPAGSSAISGRSYVLADDAPAGSSALVFTEPLVTSATVSTPITFVAESLQTPFIVERDIGLELAFDFSVDPPAASNEPRPVNFDWAIEVGTLVPLPVRFDWAIDLTTSTVTPVGFDWALDISVSTPTPAGFEFAIDIGIVSPTPAGFEFAIDLDMQKDDAAILFLLG